jgi:hypothetical protein
LARKSSQHVVRVEINIAVLKAVGRGFYGDEFSLLGEDVSLHNTPRPPAPLFIFGRGAVCHAFHPGQGIGVDVKLLENLDALPSALLLSKKPENQGKDRADQEARNDREMEAEVIFRIVEVSRQLSEPVAPDPGPDQSPNGRQDQSGHHQHFADIVHHFFTPPPKVFQNFLR